MAIAFGVFAAACSGGDEAAPTPTSAPSSTGAAADAEPDAEPEAAAQTTTVPTAISQPVAIAIRWLRDTSGIDATIVEQLEQEQVVAAGPVTHVEYAHVIGGRRVLGSEVVVHVLDDGAVQGATVSLSAATPADADEAIDGITARSYASKAIEGTADRDAAVEPVWSQLGTTLVPAFLVSTSTVDPPGAWRVVVDATSGNVLSAGRARDDGTGLRLPDRIGGSLPLELPQQTAGDACDVGAAPSACIWFNPFAQNGGPVDPVDAERFLIPVDLLGLTDDDELTGEFVDTDFPGTPLSPPAEPDGTWAGGVGSRNFEAAMAYFWIDRVQRFVQQLGFEIRSDVPTQVVPFFPEEVDNAFFDAIERRIYMGVGSNGIHAAHDAFVLIHEYGHAILDAQVGTETHFSSQELGAYSEGFSDLFAALSTVEIHNGDPACVGGWFGVLNDCFRFLDNDKVYPDDLTYAVHDDGELYAAAIWDVFQLLLDEVGLTPADCSTDEACLPIRDRVVQTILGSHYYLTAGAGFFDISNAFLRANEAAFDDADRALIESAFADRGLLGDSPAAVPGDGGVSDAPADVSLTIDITHDYRGDIRLTAGVVDADFEPLCDEIVLTEPDPQDGEDNLYGTVDISATSCAELVPPGPDQRWYLFAADELTSDRGDIVEFVVNVGGAPYPAIDLPQPIPDGDPTGIAVLVDGSTEPVDEEGRAEPGPPVDGQPYVTLDITHPYSGDLFVRAGVADPDDSIICSVPIQNPNPSDDSGGLIGSVDMSECAALFPPAPDRRWFLQVIDTAELDEGTVDAYTLTGPDGNVFEFDEVPVPIPDDDSDGIALILTDTGSANGAAGGAGRSGAAQLPSISIEIEHTYVGDLAISAGVTDADLDPLCEVVVRTPNSEDSSDDLSVNASLADCAGFFPPSPEQLWYLYVRDTFDGDAGTVERFTLLGPDGAVYDSVDAPIAIPDADQSGVALLVDGTETGVANAGALASLIIDHTFIGDLYVEIGVTDGAGTSLCSVPVTVPNPDNSAAGLAATVDLGECVDLGLYPPTPERLWFVFANDNAALETGALRTFSIAGPDGVVRTAARTPAEIPDDQSAGVFRGFDS